MNIQELPAPQNAVKGIAQPELSTQVTTSTNLVLLDVEDQLGAFDKEIYSLSVLTKWQEIAQFYDDELRRKGFVRTSHVPSDPIDSDIIYYQQNEAEPHNKIAVALINVTDRTTNKEYNFLLLCLSK